MPVRPEQYTRPSNSLLTFSSVLLVLPLPVGGLLEALLSEPDDRAGASERLAMLVACSFPRAELTRLSYALSLGRAGISAELRKVSKNQDRCDIIANAIAEGRIDLSALTPTDRAAVTRMSELLTDVGSALGAVSEYASIAFRRLYRQRNLVLHWGRTDGVALQASLRNAAPLVGAGIDRIIHAHYVDGLSPLQLVARAEVSLATAWYKRWSCLHSTAGLNRTLDPRQRTHRRQPYRVSRTLHFMGG